MRIGGDTVGLRGLALLGVAALAGIGLGLHGWSGRHSGVGPALAGSSPASASASASPPRPSPTVSAPTPAASSSQAASQGPAASRPPASSPAPAGSAGPKLSSQSYASYAFQVWPGPVSQAGRSAETGLVVKVIKRGSAIEVAAGVAGQKTPAPRLYPAGVKVYVIEASLGDDSGNSDFNLGDDGLVVTDAQGRIVQ
ncbi:MAG: hypothetical protein ACR2FU_16850 [Streptosporangiaceae bacterium]